MTFQNTLYEYDLTQLCIYICVIMNSAYLARVKYVSSFFLATEESHI